MAIKNINQLLRKFDKVGDVDLTQVIGKASMIVQKQAKELCPKDTGILASSITTEVERQGKLFIGRIFTTLEYAPYVEFGTGIDGNGTYGYDIPGLTYRNTPWVYYNEHLGQFVFTYGHEAQPYMYPALKLSKDKVIEFVNKETQKLLLGICRGG